MMRGEVFSSGGGTQSAAIAALIVRGELPKPDVAIIADTGREASEVWRYHEAILSPQLRRVGVDLVRLPHTFNPVSPRPDQQWNTVDIYSGADKDTIVMPMFTAAEGQGKLPKYCSNEWKTRPIDRYLRSLGYTEGRMWIGYSADEMERMRAYDPKKKWNHWYPLVEKRMRRHDSVRLVEEMGWPTPPRSACYMCPYRSDAEWLHLKKQDDGDFYRAVALEKKLQERDPAVYFHQSCQSLEEIDFNEAQEDLFAKPCASGMCFT